MTKLALASAMALCVTSTSLLASPMTPPGGITPHAVSQSDQVWLAQGNGNDKLRKKPKGSPSQGRANPGHGKPDHAGGPKPAGNTPRPKSRPAPAATPGLEKRDMTRILGASALVWATPQLGVADLSADELITYANCPPGLAKKDPPCVPPGLAKKGVTFDEWASYDREDYDALWTERREEWLEERGDIAPDPERLVLQSDQIATLYGLDPAPEGQQYALIDGLPVLLDDKDHAALLLVNQIAQVTDLASDSPIAPTTALTQDELVNLYRLPHLDAGQNYAVVNGQLVRLADTEYELLQLIRVARAVF